METEKGQRIRLLLAAVLITSCFGALVVRLYRLQITRHEEFLESARKMHSSVELIPAYRGTIRTRDGVILARDVLENEIGLDPQLLSRENLQKVVRLICKTMGVPAEYRRERLRVALARRESGGRYVHLADNVSETTAAAIRDAVRRTAGVEESRGLVVRPEPHRVYPRDTLAGCVVGVVDAEHRGIEGVEFTMEPYLSGRHGRRSVLKDATLKTWIFDPSGTEVAPVRGYDVHLTIDSRLQAVVQAELAAGIKREKAAAGCFLLMDCNSGDILAMASQPTYAPGHFGEYPGKERARRRSNRTAESVYQPGSVMKPFPVAYALDRRLVRRDTLIRDLKPSSVTWDGGAHARFGGRGVSDVHAYPNLTIEGAVVHSSNISLGILGLRLGRENLFQMFDGFQLCHRTGIELPAEEKGWHSSARNWKPMFSSVSVAFGYELAITPLQLCRAFASVVNGGYLLRPRIVAKISRDGEEIALGGRVVEGRPIREETSREMRDILHQVVEEGTAKWLKIPGFEYGGKTGTARAYEAKKGYQDQEYLASFEAFAPLENPRYVALCMIERPHGRSRYGGMVAGPVVAEVIRHLFHLKAETRLARIRRVAAR